MSIAARPVSVQNRNEARQPHAAPIEPADGRAEGVAPDHGGLVGADGSCRETPRPPPWTG